MTGFELKLWVLIVAAVVIAPAGILAVLRRWTTCEEEVSGVLNSVLLFLGYSVLAYVVYVVKFWDDRLEVGYLFGYPIAITFAVIIHSGAIIATAKFMQLAIPPKVGNICQEVYTYVFLGVGFLWFDLSKGDNAAIVQWLRSISYT